MSLFFFTASLLAAIILEVLSCLFEASASAAQTLAALSGFAACPSR